MSYVIPQQIFDLTCVLNAMKHLLLSILLERQGAKK